jgi:hypothetical protein
VLAFLVYRLDDLLSRLYRVKEFTDDPNCLLRIAKKKASRAVSLRDGTEVRPGDVVGELHLWNEHLPRFTKSGPTLGWARLAHRLMMRSLSVLADHVQRDPALQRVQAFYGDAPASPKRPLVAIERVASRYGFEPMFQHRTPGTKAYEAIKSLLLLLLAYAYNPAALRRQRFLRQDWRIWISRSELIRLYGRDVVRSPISTIDPHDETMP